MGFSEIWSRLTPGALTAADLAEDGVVLGDDSGLVTRVSVTGEVVSETSLGAPIRDLSAGTDGEVAVACGESGVVLLAGKRIIFRVAPGPVFTHVRLGEQGDYLLAMTEDGEGVFLNRFGREMGRFSVAGGVVGVALVRRTGQVLTVTRDGQLTGFSSWGKAVWHADAGQSVGVPDADDKGELILVPIMAYGVESYGPGGRSLGTYDVGHPVKAAACSGDGQTLLFATSDDRLVLLKPDATVVSSEVFPAPIESLRVSGDGALAMLSTGSGYAHLLALSTGGAGRFIETGPGARSTRTPWRLRERVFSPYSLVVRPAIAFHPREEQVAVAGDRRRVQVLGLDGQGLALRRFGGSLLDLRVTDSGAVRVFSSRSVFRFRADEDASTREWAGPGELAHLRVDEGGDAIGMTEAGEVLSFPAEEAAPFRLFSLAVPEVSGLALAPGSVAVAHKRGRVDVMTREGDLLADSGPWPVVPRVMATSAEGYLIGLARMCLLLRPNGEEAFRQQLPARCSHAVALPGAFLVVDETGLAWSLTATGVLRSTFRAGRGPIIPFVDAEDGPGFLLAEDNLLSAVWPDGSPRWRFRAAEPLTFLAVSGDGRHAGAFAGCDLFVFPVLQDGAHGGEDVGSAQFLEFVDG